MIARTNATLVASSRHFEADAFCSERDASCLVQDAGKKQMSNVYTVVINGDERNMVRGSAGHRVSRGGQRYSSDRCFVT